MGSILLRFQGSMAPEGRSPKVAKARKARDLRFVRFDGVRSPHVIFVDETQQPGIVGLTWHCRSCQFPEPLSSASLRSPGTAGGTVGRYRRPSRNLIVKAP